MTDRRFHAANGQVAHSGLWGQVHGVEFSDGVDHACLAAVADLCREPGVGRDKQLLAGQVFRVLDQDGTWAFGFDPSDGYVGYVAQNRLGPVGDPTHFVSTRTAHIYSAPDFKSAETACLPFLAQVAVTEITNGYAQLVGGGFMAIQHLRAVGDYFESPAKVAEVFVGTPYLWGGNSSFGIDCSGLVLMARLACGLDCPRDSDLQETAWPAVPDRDDLQAGDLVFWKGHVGMMLDATRLIHANAHHMTVTIEPLAAAVDRIGKKEFGAVTAICRP